MVMLQWKAASVIALAGAVLGCQAATAQTYPSRPVQFVVSFAPGGGADLSQRAFNKYAEPLVKQPLPIVNKAGAAGVTGWAELVRQKPDGYTLTVLTPPFNILPALVKPKQTGYTLDQFTNICIYAIVPDVLVVREDGPFKTLDDFVKFAKANPKKIKTANTGTLGADFMTTLMIENAIGIDTTQIPFNSGALALQGTLAGTTDAFVASTLYAVSQKGSLRTLAVASEKRDSMIPDVPTFKELGYDVISERYRVLGGPAGLPAEVVDYWAKVCKQVTDNPEFQAEMLKLGQPVAYRGPAEAEKELGKFTSDLRQVVEKNKLAE
jgi:tripartite-type tricarboxylate transporter receptor subunit TctC